MKKIITESEKQTISLGEKISKNFCGGEVIGLIGELGAGKTVLIKGIAQGLNIKKIITSPTFVLMKIYKIPNNKKQLKTLVHVDAYRLASGNELIDIGIKDWLEKSDTIVVIEWADNIKSILSKNTIIVNIKQGDKKNKRIIKTFKYGKNI